jgi:hypothetical protein
LLFVEAAIDLGDLVDPTEALAVLERQYLRVRPMKVKSQVGYLLVQPL